MTTPAPALVARPDTADEASQPGRDSVELQLCAIWRKLLDRKDVGVHDDFFELGGHSLLAIKHVVEIRKHFKIDITVSDLIGTRTIQTKSPSVGVAAGRRGAAGVGDGGPVGRVGGAVGGRRPAGVAGVAAVEVGAAGEGFGEVPDRSVWDVAAEVRC